MWKNTAMLSVLFFLSGCASQPVQQLAAEKLFHDSLFVAAKEVPAPDIFALNDDMKVFLASRVTPQLGHSNAPRALINALYRNGQFRLEYDSKFTRTAVEAFESSRGNCLSLLVMTSALAKSLGLQVHYQKVLVDDTWSHDKDTLIRSEHVNIILGERSRNGPFSRLDNSSIIVDFLPPDDLRGIRGYEISEATVVAMFLNNRAAETLAAGQLDAAYSLARRAIEADPDYREAMNTLGVIYRRHGNLAEAEAVFTSALRDRPDSTVLLANLALVLQKQGKIEASRKIEQRLHALEKYAPFYFLDLARTAMASNDFAKARDFYKRELDRDPDYHEAHFGLARAYLALGDPRAAREHLAQAIESSSTPEAKARYVAKLAHLRASRVN
ncbi:MAG: tetratricopeptide repeat protein [Betaproteobacteria bacterium]|nr:tetratricopeptide repeat protein [Betaproteobacteria bacterium]